MELVLIVSILAFVGSIVPLALMLVKAHRAIPDHSRVEVKFKRQDGTEAIITVAPDDEQSVSAFLQQLEEARDEKRVAAAR